jgi:hypothetical protein
VDLVAIVYTMYTSVSISLLKRQSSVDPEGGILNALSKKGKKRNTHLYNRQQNKKRKKGT